MSRPKKHALQKRYTRTVQLGSAWNTYLQIDHQSFCVVEQTSKRRAEWFAKRLATALERMIARESVSSSTLAVTPTKS